MSHNCENLYNYEKLIEELVRTKHDNAHDLIWRCWLRNSLNKINT